MKKYILFAILVFGISKPGYSQIFEDLTALQCDSLISANQSNPDFVILDVRRPSEYIPVHLTAAINRNYYDSDFELQLDSLSRHKKYLIHCASGSRSGKTHDIMFDMGFYEVYNMVGGINAWKNNALPVTDTFAPLIMFASDTIFDWKEVPIGSIDTIALTVTNRANGLLIFEEICSLGNPEFTTDFDPSITLRGAFDYQFNIFYTPQDEVMDSLSFCINSVAGSVQVTILRTGVDQTMGTTDYRPYQILTLYPNPASDFLFVNSKEPVEGVLRISNMQGIELFHIPLIQHDKIDISKLAAGQYIVSLYDKDTVQTRLLIKH